jgi:hypothetical protein
MKVTTAPSADADRLHAITQKVGFALWQLQELEGVAAHYYVLVAHAVRGMGLEAGNALVEEAQSKTFGRTVSKLVKAGLLPASSEPRFLALLAERNWLAHNSRATSRGAVHDDEECTRLIARLETVAEEALSLLTLLGEATEKHVRKHGVTIEEIDKLAAEILNSWHGGDAA